MLSVKYIVRGVATTQQGYTKHRLSCVSEDHELTTTNHCPYTICTPANIRKNSDVFNRIRFRFANCHTTTVYDKSVYPALHLVPQLTRLFTLGNLQRKTYIPKSIKSCTGANGRKALLNSLN